MMLDHIHVNAAKQLSRQLRCAAIMDGAQCHLHMRVEYNEQLTLAVKQGSLNAFQTWS